MFIYHAVTAGYERLCRGINYTRYPGTRYVLFYVHVCIIMYFIKMGWWTAVAYRHPRRMLHEDQIAEYFVLSHQARARTYHFRGGSGRVITVLLQLQPITLQHNTMCATRLFLLLGCELVEYLL